MRILVLTSQYPPHSVGGYALSCQATVEQFRLRGHSIYVLTSDARLPGVDKDSNGDASDVHRDLYLWFRDLGRDPKVPHPSFGTRWTHERRNQQALRKVLLTWRPEVVSVWEMGAMSLSTLTLIERAGIPMVITVHDYWPQYALQWDPWLRMFERLSWTRPLGAPLGMITEAPDLSGATVNVISHDLRDKLAADSRWRFPEAEIIPFGIDLRMFPVAAPVQRDWNWNILYVGRLELLKGVRTLALAMRHLPSSASLEVVGMGDPGVPVMMRDIVGDSTGHERVRFSSCPRSELVERYRAADVLVFPSEWDEPFGLVPLEAMACGVPVVATGTGGSGEYLRDGENCLLFTPGDPEHLAAAVRRLADEPALRRRIVAEGSRTAQSFSLERAATDIEKLHLDAAGRRKGHN
ncbi:MAG TPA: glycosyltransferase family 4 protein [Acidimicrobiales bacterium]|nr:glycosyltransferase family 4 protein [Acidimicrobiales bacterium]